MTYDEGHDAMLAMVARAHDGQRAAVTSAATSLLHRLGGEAFVERVTLRVSGERPAVVHELLVDGELAWRGADVRERGEWRWRSAWAEAWKPQPLRRDE